jgi:hypothetical protein
VFLTLLATALTLGLVPWSSCQFAASALLATSLLAFVGILVVAVLRFVRKDIRGGAGQVLLALLCVGATVVTLGLFVVRSMFGPSEDGFADGLSIPAGIDIAEPRAESFGEAPVSQGADAFQQTLMAALKTPAQGDATVQAELPSWVRLQPVGKERLLRYLAAHPAWRVFREHGKLYATRRWREAGGWRYTLHGYYSDFRAEQIPPTESFQSRLTLGFDRQPWAGMQDGALLLRPGDSKRASLKEGNRLQESWVLIQDRDWVVEVFEQSSGTERRLTKAAIRFLEYELAPLAAGASWKQIRELLPADAITRGAPSLELSSSFQPGIYDVFIRANPGEPGMVYLKAFEVTRGTPLSADRLTEKSNEWIGWSGDPSEQFFSNTNITIYEGDWGKPYAARFEVWFKPDSGATERKLFEKIYKIEGWQR